MGTVITQKRQQCWRKTDKLLIVSWTLLRKWRTIKRNGIKDNVNKTIIFLPIELSSDERDSWKSFIHGSTTALKHQLTKVVTVIGEGIICIINVMKKDWKKKCLNWDTHVSWRPPLIFNLWSKHENVSRKQKQFTVLQRATTQLPKRIKVYINKVHPGTGF